MLGFNGGLIGVANPVQRKVSLPGAWTANEQVIAKRQGTWPQTKPLLLLHCDGDAGSTTITDSGTQPRAISVFGNAAISTTQSKFGGASLALDGVGDFLNFSVIVLSGDFTAEAWVYKTARDGSGYSIVFGGTATSGASNTQLAFDNTTEGSISAVIGGSTAVTQSGTAVTTNAWNHLAWSRSGTSVRQFVNGVQRGTTGTSTGSLVIGNISRFASGGFEVNGYLDEIAVFDYCKYTANFAPPSEPYP